MPRREGPRKLCVRTSLRNLCFMLAFARCAGLPTTCSCVSMEMRADSCRVAATRSVQVVLSRSPKNVHLRSTRCAKPDATVAPCRKDSSSYSKGGAETRNNRNDERHHDQEELRMGTRRFEKARDWGVRVSKRTLSKLRPERRRTSEFGVMLRRVVALLCSLYCAARLLSIRIQSARRRCARQAPWRVLQALCECALDAILAHQCAAGSLPALGGYILRVFRVHCPQQWCCRALTILLFMSLSSEWGGGDTPAHISSPSAGHARSFRRKAGEELDARRDATETRPCWGKQAAAATSSR